MILPDIWYGAQAALRRDRRHGEKARSCAFSHEKKEALRLTPLFRKKRFGETGRAGTTATVARRPKGVFVLYGKKAVFAKHAASSLKQRKKAACRQRAAPAGKNRFSTGGSCH